MQRAEQTFGWKTWWDAWWWRLVGVAAAAAAQTDVADMGKITETAEMVEAEAAYTDTGMTPVTDANADAIEIGVDPANAVRPPWLPGATPDDLKSGRLRLPAAAEVRSPAAGDRGEKAARRVAVFDFEETNDVGVKLGRGVPLPPGWYAVGRPPQSSDANFGRLSLHADLTGRTGFPPYNPVGYSELGQGRRASASGTARDPDGYALHLGCGAAAARPSCRWGGCRWCRARVTG